MGDRLGRRSDPVLAAPAGEAVVAQLGEMLRSRFEAALVEHKAALARHAEQVLDSIQVAGVRAQAAVAAAAEEIAHRTASLLAHAEEELHSSRSRQGVGPSRRHAADTIPAHEAPPPMPEVSMPASLGARVEQAQHVEAGLRARLEQAARAAQLVDERLAALADQGRQLFGMVQGINGAGLDAKREPAPAKPRVAKLKANRPNAAHRAAA
jgi:hypothetical protein